jgi:2,4-dienoyl-CoA reductase-like NADH-dependent reductase (Old Yellow Enzyme family)
MTASILKTGTIDALFQPLTIRGLDVANRFVMSPMTRSFSPGGTPGEDVAAYYERRALGGVGLIVTEGVGVDHPAAIGDAGLSEENVPQMYGDAALAGWRQVVERVHAAGGKIVPQLWHQGVMRRSGGPQPEAESVRPSGLWGPVDRLTSVDSKYLEWAKVPTRPATDEEVQNVIDGFARSARHARDVGFDGIALHGGHGYLLDSFMWEDTNRRAAPWGGPDGRGRSAMPAAVVKAIRREIGDLPIFYRFSQWKLQDFKGRLGRTPDELAQVLEPLTDAGVDVFDASTRYFDRAEFPEQSQMSLAGWAKKLTGRLSMTVGGIGLGASRYTSDGKRADVIAAANNLPQLLARFERGEFDLAAVGRALLADPNWVRKVRAGDERFVDYSENMRLTLY